VFQDYYRAVTRKGDPARIKDLAARLEQGKSDNAEMLNEMAWTLLTDEKIKTRNPALALHLAKAAFDASGGRDVSVLDTYARALFDNDKVSEAIRQQKRAIELCEDPARRGEFEESLKRYQSRKPAAPSAGK